MRFSRSFIPTLRESPSDAASRVHALLLRGAVIRRTDPGCYHWLPLGAKLLENMERLIVQAATSSEVQRIRLYPAMDSTSDEAVHDLASHTLLSWRALPQRWWDTNRLPMKRPGRNWSDDAPSTFLAWSLDLDDAGRSCSLAMFRSLIDGVLSKIGFKGKWLASLPSGTGLWIAESDTGGSAIVECASCGYGDLADHAVHQASMDGLEPSISVPEDLKLFPTPGVRTIRDLECPPYNIPAHRQLKTLVMLADNRPCIAVVRGDRNLSEERLREVLCARTVVPAEAEQVRSLMGALPGSLGGVGTEGKDLWVDSMLANAASMVTGANRDDFHFRGVSVRRHLGHGRFACISRVENGDPCPVCGAPLRIGEGTVVGTVRAPSTLWAGRKRLSVMGPERTEITILPATARFFLDRILCTIAEDHHDDDGFRWPALLAPYKVAILTLQPRDPAVCACANRLHDAIALLGVEVLLDDRDERAGVKFKDADLVGAPIRIGVGPRGLATGSVEWKDRSSQEIRSVSIDEVPSLVLSRLSELGWRPG